MPEFQSVIVVRLIFLKHSLNQDTLPLKNPWFPVHMELSGFIFDQVYKILPSIVLKNPLQTSNLQCA